LVQPPLRQITDPGGQSVTAEPRVLQVLIALSASPGTVVSRDELIASCWGGRIVGDDAINRVIGLVRRLAEGIGRGSFRIETVARVGYRLLEDPPPSAAAEPGSAAPAMSGRFDRRMLIGGIGVGALALAGGGRFLATRNRSAEAPPADIAPLLTQAATAVQQGTAEGADQAIGLLRRAVELRPDYADAWGRLALTYAVTAQARAGPVREELRARAREAVRRAEGLEPGNVHSALAVAQLIPQFGNWARIESTLRHAQAGAPDNQPLLIALGTVLGSVGRSREGAALIDRAVKIGPPSPALAQFEIQALWSAGRTDEADRAATQAFATYPSHFGIWFARLHLLLESGRAREALSQIDNPETRPAIIAPSDFPMLERIAHAALSRTAGDIDRAVDVVVAAARWGAGYAENAIQYAAMFGRADAAFAIADAYYFDRGFTVADRRFTNAQRTATQREERRTRFLFFPTVAPIRQDARFARLVDGVGLARYWKETGTDPDYRSE
jgi:DNA-binding winged helix-turn-helix (wHTH) protein/tetratricopeptide (TPR) repeat protein